MDAKSIIETLNETGIVELENNDSIIVIRFRKFFGTDKSFNFELNCKPVFGCKGKATANKKITKLIASGFVLSE